MGNLTQTYGVVKPDVASAPLEGYKVVVLEETLGGTKLKMILNPGDRPLKKKNRFFSPSPNYSCYAVSTDTNLNFDFESKMTLAAQHQHFNLNFTVYHYVSSPKLMALAFRTDPIKRIQEEIKRRLQKNILETKIEIEDIQDDFFQIKEKILPYTTLNQLRDFSGEFGVILKEINMTYSVPDRYLAPNREKEDYYLKKTTSFIEEEEKRKKQEEEKDKLRHSHELRKIEFEHERDKTIHQHDLQELKNIQDEKNTHHNEAMEDVRSYHEFRREMPKRVITAIDRAIGTINSAESLEKVADSSINVIKKLESEIRDPDQTFSEKQIASTGSEMKALIAESSGPFEEAKEFLLKVFSKVEISSIQPGDKKAILSCITHLLGEIQLEENADPEMIHEFVGKLSDYTIKYRKIFTRDVILQISNFKEKFDELIAQAEDNSCTSDIPDRSDTPDK